MIQLLNQLHYQADRTLDQMYKKVHSWLRSGGFGEFLIMTAQELGVLLRQFEGGQMIVCDATENCVYCCGELTDIACSGALGTVFVVSTCKWIEKEQGIGSQKWDDVTVRLNEQFTVAPNLKYVRKRSGRIELCALKVGRIVLFCPKGDVFHARTKAGHDNLVDPEEDDD